MLPSGCQKRSQDAAFFGIIEAGDDNAEEGNGTASSNRNDYLEQAEDIRHSPLGKASYALRSQTIERVFADAKEKHAMRYTPYRGLPAVTAWVKLKFTALNLKKLAIHKWMRLLVSSLLHIIEATLQHGKVASLTV